MSGLKKKQSAAAVPPRLIPSTVERVPVWTDRRSGPLSAAGHDRSGQCQTIKSPACVNSRRLIVSGLTAAVFMCETE